MTGTGTSFQSTYSETTNATNWLTQIGTLLPSYDNNGNLTSDTVHGYTWDAEGKMGVVARPSVNTATTVGAPILARTLRKGGWQTVRTMGLAFMPPVPETKSFPNPHSPALAQVRPEDRSDDCSSVYPPDSVHSIN